jgi:hypothetical protein
MKQRLLLKERRSNFRFVCFRFFFSQVVVDGDDLVDRIDSMMCRICANRFFCLFGFIFFSLFFVELFFLVIFAACGLLLLSFC